MKRFMSWMVCLLALLGALSLPMMAEASVSEVGVRINPRVTQKTVTWNGGYLRIPVDFGGYSIDELYVIARYIGEDSNDNLKSTICFAKLQSNAAMISILESYGSCDRVPLLSKPGSYDFQLEFNLVEDNTISRIKNDTFSIVVPKESSLWSVSDETVSFDGTNDIFFSFKNGTNYYVLQSISKIELFISKNTEVFPNPIITKGFTFDMREGTLKIDGTAVTKALIERNPNIRGKIFINVYARTNMGEEVLFNRIDWKGHIGGTTTAWSLDVTRLKIPVNNISVPKKGEKLTDSKTMIIYKVTKSGKEVEYIKSTKKNLDTVVLPETVKIDSITYKVTSIADCAFMGNKKLKKITIPKNIISIGSKAFYNCKALRNIVINSEKLTTKNIGNKAFTKAGSNDYRKLTVKIRINKYEEYKKLLRKKGLSSKVKLKK